MLFTPMKIYYCTYSNFHNDPNPVLFVMNSTSKYTEGLNIRYLSPARKSAFYNMIRRLADVRTSVDLLDGKEEEVNVKFHYTGQMMYEIIKKYYPDFAHVAYRKYFSYYLVGKIVNDSLNASSPLTELYIRTQALLNQSSSNILQNRARKDRVVNEVNNQLISTRVEDMKKYDGLEYTVQEDPGPSQTRLPNQPGPEDVSPEELSKIPDKNKKNNRLHGEDITPGN